MAPSQKRTTPLPHKNGTAYRVSLPDGSSQHVLLREVEDLVTLLENTYEGSEDVVIDEVNDLIDLLIIKQNEEQPAPSGTYEADSDIGGGTAVATSQATPTHTSSDKRYLSSTRNLRAYENADPKPPKYEGGSAGYYLQSEMTAMQQAVEGEEQEEETIEQVSDEQFQRLENKVSEARGDLNQARLDLRDALESGDEDAIEEATKDTQRATNRHKKAQRAYKKAQRTRQRATDAEEAQAEEDARPPEDPSMENLERLIQIDANSREVFKILDYWSQEERKVVEQLSSGEESLDINDIRELLNSSDYMDHPAVQNLLTAINKLAGRSSGEGVSQRDGVSWRNVQRVAELPMVKAMSDVDESEFPDIDSMKSDRNFRENYSLMNSHMPRLLERIDSISTITPKVMEYFEKHGKLPPMELDPGSDEGKEQAAWDEIPLRESVWTKVRDADWDEADLETEIPIAGIDRSIATKDVLQQLGSMQGMMHDQIRVDPRRRGTFPLKVPKDSSKPLSFDNQEILQISFEAAYQITDMLKNVTPGKPDFDTLSNAFIERFAELSDRSLSDPTIGTNHLVRELYGSTRFSEFHQELGMDLEKSSNSLLAGLVKDTIAKTNGGEVIHHGSGDEQPKRNRYKVRETTWTSTTEEGVKVGRTGQRVGSFVNIQRGYDLYSEELVGDYVGFHRDLNRQLLDITYPNTDTITVFRGTNRAEIAEDTGEEEAAVITPRRRRGFFRTLFKGGREEARKDLTVGVVSNSLSAFSVNPEIAKGFASNPRSTRGAYDVSSGPYENTPAYEGGVCLALEINKDDIFTTYGNGHGGGIRQGNEGEMWAMNSGGNLVAKAYNPQEFQDAYYEGWEWGKEQSYFIDDPQRPVEGERTRQIYAKSMTLNEFRKAFAKQQDIPQFHIVVDDPVNSDWITTSYESSIPKPDLGMRSNMEAIPVPFPWEEDEPEKQGMGTKSGMDKVLVEETFVPHTTPTVQKSYIEKQQELGQTLAQADPTTPAKASEEDTVHPAAQGKVRTYINELVHRAGKTFERRRTAWVRPQVAEALEARQKASDWLRLLGNYLPLYFVGGFIRDKLTGKVSREIDIISLATLDEVKEVFEEVNLTFEQKKTTKGRPSIVFKVGDMNVRVVCAEAEDLPKELMQRDFTINAVAQSVTGQFYDPSNGLKDIKARVLRSPKNGSVKKFDEDPIRILRAARFMSHYNLKVHSSVVRAVKKHRDKLSDVSKDRIGKELTQILQSENPKKAFEFLQKYDLLGYIDPAIEKMVGFRQNTIKERWDLWRHTTTALRDSESEDLIVNLSILFHAIGKTKVANEDNTKFPEFEKASGEIAREVMETLEFPEDQIKRVENLVILHKKLSEFTSETSQDDFENLKIQIGDDFARLIAVTKADIKGSSTEVEEKLEVLDNVLNHFDKINKNKFYDSVSKDIEDIIGMVANG